MNESLIEIDLDLQIATETNNLPSFDQFKLWVTQALHLEASKYSQVKSFYQEHRNQAIEMTIRVVDSEEIQQLNSDYREKNKPTNVLSFPFESFSFSGTEITEAVQLPILGDIVICSEIVIQEATEQNKPLEHHWAHMVIHGCLHLLGYDHITDRDAVVMESLETEVMAQLGLSDPYQ